MVKVRLFGILRLDNGVKELEADVQCVRDLYPLIIEKAKAIDPKTKVTAKDLRGCIVSVNGRQVRPSTKLGDWDEVILVPAVAGG